MANKGVDSRLILGVDIIVKQVQFGSHREERAIREF